MNYIIKHTIRIAIAFTALVVSSSLYAQGYQRLDPVAVYSANNGDLYIVIEQNIGTRGCAHDKNSILLKPNEHSADFIKSSLSIALAAVAAKQSLKVYWDGCLSGGRPKATLIGLGSEEIN